MSWRVFSSLPGLCSSNPLLHQAVPIRSFSTWWHTWPWEWKQHHPQCDHCFRWNLRSYPCAHELGSWTGPRTGDTTEPSQLECPQRGKSLTVQGPHSYQEHVPPFPSHEKFALFVYANIWRNLAAFLLTQHIHMAAGSFGMTPAIFLFPDSG